jgi:hypothetical protein
MDNINEYSPDMDESDDQFKQSDDETTMDESVQPHDKRDPITDSSGEIDTYQQDIILEDQSTATSTVITPSGDSADNDEELDMDLGVGSGIVPPNPKNIPAPPLVFELIKRCPGFSYPKPYNNKPYYNNSRTWDLLRSKPLNYRLNKIKWV